MLSSFFFLQHLAQGPNPNLGFIHGNTIILKTSCPLASVSISKSGANQHVKVLCWFWCKVSAVSPAHFGRLFKPLRTKQVSSVHGVCFARCGVGVIFIKGVIESSCKTDPIPPSANTHLCLNVPLYQHNCSWTGSCADGSIKFSVTPNYPST